MVHVKNEVIEDLRTNGPATPAVIAKRIGQPTTRMVWRHLLRMANAGEVVFDPTGRIASLVDTSPDSELFG